MRRRTASQSQSEQDGEYVAVGLRRAKRRDRSLQHMLETSQVLLDERSNAQKYRHFYSLLKFAHTQLQVCGNSFFSEDLQTYLLYIVGAYIFVHVKCLRITLCNRQFCDS